MSGQFLFDLPLPAGWRLLSVDAIKSPEKHSCVAGPFGSSISSKFFVEEGVPVIRGGNLRDDLTPFVAEGFVFVSPEQAQRYKGQHVRGGDLVFTCWGTLGQVGLIPKNGPFPEYIISNKQLKLRPNGEIADSRFLFYYFGSPHMVRHIRSIAVGAAVPGINLGLLKALQVALPPLDVQREIVRVLSAYDDLIENNTRRIKILEVMAQRIYREWFVHFRFPGHENVPMVQSELGPIPEGWAVHKVKDLTSRISPGRRYDQRSVCSTGRVPVLDQGKSGIIGYHNDAPGVRASYENPIIVFANHTCYQRLVLHSFSAIQNILPFRSHNSHERNIHWLHWATKDLIVFNDYKGHWPEFMGKLLTLPPKALCSQFGGQVEPIARAMYVLDRASTNLRATRDLLLPKLISGEIPVEAAKDTAAELMEQMA